MELTDDIKKWINKRVNGCLKRALNRRAAGVWRKAITAAVLASDGRCPYTGIRLDFSRPSYDPFYPSLDHKDGPDSTNLGVTVRLVNDMKSLMTEEEFLRMVKRIYHYRVLGKKTAADERALKPGRGFKKGNVKF